MQRLLVVLLLLAPVALPGLAHASPPDPTWIPGIYDDADGDDIVSLIASGTGHLPPAAPTDLPFIARLVARLTPTLERMPLGLWASAASPRAPPAP
ncbi:MAG TPA: hypothetical protein VEP12_06185 [Candidatus Acidoferrum sp.]|jgi:hypothetical protein|nr:hypothetical protein [Candidatus Acidoferrum sp.]